MEVLQILKYSICQKPLSFIDDWLMAEGKAEEILSLIEEAQQVVAAEIGSDSQ